MNNLISEYNSKKRNGEAEGRTVTKKLLAGGIRLYLYEKKIVYLSLYESGIKKASAGFTRVSREKNAFVLDIHIKNDNIFFGRKYPIFLIADKGIIEWGTITGQQGKADARRCFELKDGHACFEDEKFEEKDIHGILITLDGQCEISGYWQEAEGGLAGKSNSDLSAAGMEETCEKKLPQGESSGESIFVEGTLAESVSVEGDYAKKMPVEGAALKKEFFIQPASENKWERLQSSYKTVHPFGDERVFLWVELKDLIILQAPYQKLANNSFLLHGFYNYRHMILGLDRELGGGEGDCFYLGVPGTYFDREKTVAIMFGFEGFECDGAVETGKFGYYMRRVEL